MPKLITLDNPKQRASYLSTWFIQVHVNQKENILVFPFGDLNTTPAPHPCLHLDPSKYIIHISCSLLLVTDIGYFFSYR